MSIGTEESCNTCGKLFYVAPWWKNKGGGKYCSRKCYHKSREGIPPWNTGTKGVMRSNSGSFKSREWKWKGTISEYKQLHYWVGKYLGKPNKCEKCKGIKTGRRIHWANKSGLYEKDKNDWIRLCARCHFYFDKKDIINRKIKERKKNHG